MPSNYVLLERIELNATVASVTFANIPQSGYTDLKVVVSARSTSGYAGENVDDMKLNFNNNTSAAYSRRQVESNGSVAGSGNTPNSTFLYAGTCVSNTATASTFGNYELFIPNYLSSNNKSLSMDVANENNATKTYAQLQAGLWANTSAINRIDFGLVNGSFVQYSTFSLYGLAAVGTAPAIAPKASGGNIIDFDGTYWIHTFTSTGTFTPALSLSCDYLVVAGGGGGRNGGGGAGGYRTSIGGSSLSVSAQAYTITVGAGGVGATPPTKGGNSTFSTITSTGGGRASIGTPADANGGSGGGSADGAGQTGGTGNQGGYSPVEGYNGGSGASGGAGAGGGSSANGGNSTTNTGGAGGAGTANSISGSSVTYAGGGGGGGSSTGGAGGAGGGGTGQSNSSGMTAGTANTGGGGGGGWSGVGLNGGSGIVIIRYLAS
jgi:hypothetical protein